MVIARSLRGMRDLFESDLVIVRYIENIIHQACHIFGYQEIRTPLLEELALFKRSVGETSDIVEKEMFLVEDGEHTYCLRPENTAPVVRALIERGGISEDTQEKLYYIGPMFRKERPQKGRSRQFHQFGMEIFGVSDAAADIEIIVMMNHVFTKLSLSGITLKINTLGQADERKNYVSLLRVYLEKHVQELCSDCARRIVSNPLRVLDCKNPDCHAITLNAPKIIDTLGDNSRAHFAEVLRGLSEQGIKFEIDNYLVRGLDYYNRTVFEFVADTGLGSQNAVAAGGRYDGLFTTLGNKIDLPAIGCAVGIERVALLLDEKIRPSSRPLKLALVGADGVGQAKAINLGFALRNLGVATDFSLIKKSLKAQMRRADKLNAQFVAVLGEQEIEKNRVILKGLSSKTSHELELDAQTISKFLNTN